MTKNGRALYTTLLTFAFTCLICTQVAAQNVFINLKTGHLLASLTSGQEVGFENGGSAVWKHSQLPLTVSVSDYGTLTSGGELSNPAGNLIEYNGALCFEGGTPENSYMLVSLPKGFRFTGYSITLVNDLNNKDILGGNGAIEKTFLETGSDWDYTKPLATAADASGNTRMGSSNSATEYTMARKAVDMGNRLYFMIHTGGKEFFGLTIKNFEIFFVAENDFTEPLSPNLSSRVSYVESPFEINKLELGEIKQRTKNGKTYFAFTYENVKDLMASMMLYQADAVKDGRASDVAATKTISATSLEGKSYFLLGNNTYFVESPTTVKGESGKDMPVGYRITGAKLTASRLANLMTLSIETGGETRYLDSDLKVSTTPAFWTWDGSRLKNGNSYLRVSGGGLFSAPQLSITPSVSRAASFYKDESNRIYCSSRGRNYYINLGGSVGSSAEMSGSSSYAAAQNTLSGGDFTVELYGTDKSAPVKTATLSASSPSAELEVTGLNNDAVMFVVKGLPAGALTALMNVEVTMQHLNPYIHSLDIIAHDGAGQTLKQTFTADNFAVRGGHFVFNVPQSFTEECRFTFENLRSNYADATYYDGSGNGNARYCFVESEYYKATPSLYGESYSPNSDYTKKVYTDVAGDEPFYFNNIDELHNESGSSGVRYLEEYPFSIDKYENPDHGKAGKFTTFTLKDKEEKDAYLFVSDETRYNIAPTTATEHRHYAYYMMDIELAKKVYSPVVNFTKEYDKTFIEGSNEGNLPAHWGVRVSTTYKTDDGSYGYLSLADIDAAVKEAIEKGGEGVPSTEEEIIYVDMSELQQIIYPENTGDMTAFDVFRSSYSPNVLLFLPSGTTVSSDNCASRSGGGEVFNATRNIILRDKYPFFSPYRILVDATHYALYTRAVTNAENGKPYNSTLILPFRLKVDADGVHTNDAAVGDGMQVTLGTLSPDNCLSLDSRGNYVARIIPYTSSTGYTEANVPYIVQLPAPSSIDEISFTVLQHGATVEATSGYESGTYAFGRSASTGEIQGASLTLTPQGTFSGRCIPKDDDKCFYFAADRFRSSWSLIGYDNVYLYPFRTYFDLTSGMPSRNASFGVTFSPEEGVTTGVGTPADSNVAGISVRAGRGSLSMMSRTDTEVSIYSGDGNRAASLSLRAGESTVVSLSSGVYIVEGKKYLVK